MRQFILWQVILRQVILWQGILRQVILRQGILRQVILWQVILWQVILRQVILRQGILLQLSYIVTSYISTRHIATSYFATSKLRQGILRQVKSWIRVIMNDKLCIVSLIPILNKLIISHLVILLIEAGSIAFSILHLWDVLWKIFIDKYKESVWLNRLFDNKW